MAEMFTLVVKKELNSIWPLHADGRNLQYSPGIPTKNYKGMTRLWRISWHTGRETLYNDLLQIVSNPFTYYA